MPRPANIMRGVRVHVYIPEDLYAKVLIALYSDSEQRVPHGAISGFINSRIREYFNSFKEQSDDAIG